MSKKLDRYDFFILFCIGVTVFVLGLLIGLTIVNA